ncbi:MAG: response regulator, partial [Chitinophagales bacterium]|nr:response regulator [Chitinophagales bacterium]
WLPTITDNPPKYIYHFAPDKFGKTWIATDQGLLLLDINSKKIIAQYFSGGKGKYHLPFDNIYHIYHDPDGSLWLGTGGNGLVHWNKGAPLMNAPLSTADKDSSTYFQQFSISSGLNNTIYAVYEDDSKQLWLPSDYGIIRFNKHTNSIKTYLEVDGITHHEFNRVSHFEAADGRLFFGSLDGVTMFHPKDFQEDSLITNFPLIITAFHLIDQDGNQSQEARQKLLKNHTITYRPDDRLFRIEFALLTYENATKVRYAYKLEGIEKEWNYQNEHFIRYSRLPYGNYNLRIKGQGAYGQWSDQELTIKLSIIKPFYLRFWFIALSIFCIAAMIILYFRWRNAKLIQRQQFLEAEVNRQTQKIRQQAEELKSLEKLKSRFFANVSHELRTPLSLMLGPLDSLLHKNYDKEKSHQFLRFIFKNCQHLLKLVNEILDLSKLEKGILEVSPSLIHFHSFLQRLLTQFGSIGDSKALLFNYKYHCDINLHLFLDTDKFEKIIHNYLSNAIKFTPKGGTISMVVTEKENQILISVKDAGLGIHPEDLPFIFDRFYQSKRSEMPIQGGTGIGLSLCKELAELLDGKVWAESKMDEGSIFYFQFAMVKATTDQVAQNIEDNFHTLDETSFSNENKSITPSLPLSQQLKSIEDTTSLIAVPDTLRRSTILVVEDNTDLRNYLSTILEENFEVITAENGKEALALIHAQQKNESIDLIISDLMMPVMDGFQFLEAIKQEDKLRHIPVIMLTARADVRVKLKALRIGIDDYLVKPFIEAELILRIQNLLDNLHERILLFANASTNLHNNTKKPILSEVDANWLKEVEAAFAKIIPDAQLHLDWVADHLFISKKQLTRRIKQLTGLTPNKYIREMRLQLARDYLYVGKYHTVKEVAIAVGFSDTKYFSKLFQERFGILPSEQLN